MADNLVKSNVTDLLAIEQGCRITLKNPQYKPKGNVFLLVLEHPNYNALFSLASMAAMSGRPLKIITQGKIVPTQQARVKMLAIDF